MTVKTLHILTIGLFILFAGIPGSALANPAATVERFHDALMQSMKAGDTWSVSQRQDALAQPVIQAFDLDLMARLAAGSGFRKADEADRQAYVDAFSAMTIRTYAGQFNSFSGQSFETISEKAGPQNTQLVTTQIRDGDERHTLTYVVREARDGAWRIVDVLLGSSGISQLAVRRSEYTAVLKSGGLTALTAALEKQ